MAKKIRRRHREIEEKSHEGSDITYIMTHDGVITLNIDGDMRIITKSHNFYNIIKESCLLDDLVNAVKFAGVEINLCSWNKQVGLRRSGNSWVLDGEPIFHEYTSQIDRLVNSGVNTNFVIAALNKQASSTIQEGDDVQVLSPLTDAFRANIAYMGLSELFRRHSHETTDYADDVEFGISYTVSRLKEYDMAVLFVTKAGKQLIAVEVPREYDKINEALEYVHRNHPSVTRIINNAKQVASANTESKKTRRVTLD